MNDIHPIKPAYEVSWVWLGIVILTLIGLVWWWHRRRRRREPLPEVVDEVFKPERDYWDEVEQKLEEGKLDLALLVLSEGLRVMMAGEDGKSMTKSEISRIYQGSILEQLTIVEGWLYGGKVVSETEVRELLGIVRDVG